MVIVALAVMRTESQVTRIAYTKARNMSVLTVEAEKTHPERISKGN